MKGKNIQDLLVAEVFLSKEQPKVPEVREDLLVALRKN